RFATRVMADATREVLESAGLSLSDVQWVIPHQANYRIIEAAARGLDLPMDRFIINLDRYGNTSTASIPMAACEAVEKGQLKAGDTIVLVGFGAGLTWGALVAKWTGPLPTTRRVYPSWYRFLARLRSALRRLDRFVERVIWGRRA
ncbi:MAG: ketoacyl-ACP synthase III, partial [Anaerolineae bacterium]